MTPDEQRRAGFVARHRAYGSRNVPLHQTPSSYRSAADSYRHDYNQGSHVRGNSDPHMHGASDPLTHHHGSSRRHAARQNIDLPSVDRSGTDRPNASRPSVSRPSASRPRSTPRPYTAPRHQFVSQSEANDPNRYRALQRSRSHARATTDDAFEYSAPDAAPKKHRKHSPAKILLAVVGCLIVALVVAAVGFSFTISSRLNNGIDAATRAELTPAAIGQPYYMLLIGTDRSAERVANKSTGDTFRTDSLILARIDPLAAKLTLVSLQRDTLVNLDQHGNQKLNAAYTYGGAPLLIKTVSKLAGVPIAHYAEIDFDSFIQVVDAIGGINVNIPIALDDVDANIHLKAGQQTINGAQALGLCRARHAYDKYGSGDYYRTSNQRMVLGAILHKGLSGSPTSLIATIDSASKSVRSDISGFDILFLGVRFIGFNMERDLCSGLEPTKPSYKKGVWYELLDTDAWKKMMSRVDQGLPPYENASQDPTAGLAGSSGATAQ